MKKILSLLLSAVLIFAALPSASFAGTVTLSDSDGRMNVAYKADGDDAYVGLDAEISEEGNNGKHQPQYYIVRNYNDAFKIDIDTGKVYIDDASKLSAENELVTIRIRVVKKNKSDEMDFGINVNPTADDNDVDDDMYRVVVGEINNFYTSDVYGRIYSVDVVDKTVQYMADNAQTWSDIANDSSTVLYGVKYDGNLWKNLLENSYTYEKYIKDYWWSDGINALTMDDQGNAYFVEDEDLMFYNMSDKHWKQITKLMDLEYPSLGDIVFHGDKLYYAAYTSNHGILVEVDIDRNTTKVLGNIPDNTYGLASVNDELYLLYGSTVGKYDLQTNTYSDYMPVSGSRTIYGAAQGDTIETGNILDAVETLDYPRLATVEGQWIYRGPERIRIPGEYGSLLINYNGDFVYILDSKSVDVEDLESGERLVDTFDFYAFNSWYGWYGWHDWYHGYHNHNWDIEENSIDIVIVPGDNDTNPENTGLHLDASDLDGDGVEDSNMVEGQSVNQWHDSLGYDNTAEAQGGSSPVLVLDGINGHPAVDFKDISFGMNIDSSSEIGTESFLNKTVATVFKTGDSVDGVQYVYEEGGIWRGYNFVIAPDADNEDAPTLYAMAYNKREWDAQEAYKVVKLSTVQPDTVYSAVLVQDSSEGTFRAYLNGVAAELEETQTLSSIDKQYEHSNTVGLGWFNTEAVDPNDKNAHDTSNTGGGDAFDGMIGEVYVLNQSLNFMDVQTLVGDLNDKWKPDVVEAVENVTVLQSGDQLSIGWDKVSGVSNYEIILSDDDELSDDDQVISVSSFRNTLTLSDAQLNQDELNIFVRYEVSGVDSDVAAYVHKLYSQPDNFTYTPVEGDQTLFRFSNESGKSYVIRYENQEFPVGASMGYQTVDNESIPDPTKAELYEVATDGTKVRFDLGHSIKADGPTYKALDAVVGLTGTLNGDQIELSWNKYPGAESYEIYGGVSADSLVNLDMETSALKQTFELDDWEDMLFYYFKVRAKVPPTETGYAYSDFSEVERVLTPVFGDLVDRLNNQWENGVAGPDENGYYALGQYEEGALEAAKAAVQTAQSILDAYEAGTASADVLGAAYETLKDAADALDQSQITASNRISLVFKDNAGNPIEGGAIGDGTYTVTNGYAVFYGPNGYDELKIDITIEGYSCVEGSQLSLVFSNETQEITLTYEDSLPAAIGSAESVLGELGAVAVGPNEDGFYTPGQYHGPYYEALKDLIGDGNALLKDSTASGAEKNAKASEILLALERFEGSLVTENTTISIDFRKLSDPDNADFTVNGVTGVVKYAPAGIVVTLNAPYDEVFADNYFVPSEDTLEFTFGTTAKTQVVQYVPSSLYELYLTAGDLIDNAVEGLGEGESYSLGQYVKDAKESSGLNDAFKDAEKVLSKANASDAEIEAATEDLQDALAAFAALEITEDNRIEVKNISAETGKALEDENGVDTVIYYGPIGYALEIAVPSVDHYQAYQDAYSGSTEVYTKIELEFTDVVQHIYVMYHEDVNDPLTSADKDTWEEDALKSIIEYADEDRIEWRHESAYDEDGTISDDEASLREHEDFLNILDNALIGDDKEYADPEFVADYIEDIETGETDINDYEDLIEMIKKYYDEISDSFYSFTPGSGTNNGKLENTKTIFYADPINTSVVFTIKDSNITDPEFHFELIGNEYLTYDYPLIELYKLSTGQDPSVDPSVLNKGSIQSSNTRVSTIVDKETDEYGYAIVVQPDAEEYKKDEIYYARVITSVRVNEESSMFVDAVEDAESKEDKHRLAVDEVVEMYNNNTDSYYYYDGHKDENGNSIKVVRINSDDLQYAIGVIHDKSNGNKSLVDGLQITSQSKWMINGESEQTVKKVDGLSLDLASKPALPRFIE